MSGLSHPVSQPYQRSDKIGARVNPGQGAPPNTAAQAAEASYYGVPVIHKPHWKWLVIVYFFLGGISGAAYTIAAIAGAVGPSSDRSLVRAGRYLSFATLLPCPVLLILDLGRPERFLYMLRVLKLRSPMSLGTWGLTIFGAFASLSAVQQIAADKPTLPPWVQRSVCRVPPHRIAIAGVPFALFVSGYTGVLLAATAVPLWAKRGLLLGPLFLTAALSSGVSALTALLALRRSTSRDALHRLDNLERVTLVTELVLLVSWIIRLGRTAKPITEGSTGRLLRYGVIGAGLTVPLALDRIFDHQSGSRPRTLHLLSATLVLVGGFALRYVVVVGGQASADDPQATFDLTRLGQP